MRDCRLGVSHDIMYTDHLSDHGTGTVRNAGKGKGLWGHVPCYGADWFVQLANLCHGWGEAHFIWGNNASSICKLCLTEA